MTADAIAFFRAGYSRQDSAIIIQQEMPPENKIILKGLCQLFLVTF